MFTLHVKQAVNACLKNIGNQSHIKAQMRRDVRSAMRELALTNEEVMQMVGLNKSVGLFRKRAIQKSLKELVGLHQTLKKQTNKDVILMRHWMGLVEQESQISHRELLTRPGGVGMLLSILQTR